MASLSVEIHSVSPQAHKIQKVVQAMHDGGVALYPTDSGFALGCCLSKKNAIKRIREIRRLPQNKHLSFLCDSLRNIAEYAKVSNHAYRTLRRLVPGPYTFILPATKAVPDYALDPKRKTTGIRVPKHPVAMALLQELGNPLISISAKSPTDEEMADIETPEELVDRMSSVVDIVVTAEVYNFLGESTVIDMTSDDFSIVRRGAGMDEVLLNVPELVID